MESFLLSVQFNTLYYWKYGSENDWDKAHRFAQKNYKLLLASPEKIKLFPEVSTQIFYNYLNAISILGRGGYAQASKKMSELIVHKHNKRLKQDALFYLNLSKLIHLNRNRTNQSGKKVVMEAEHFIEQNKQSFSVFRLNNFYFDLAKAYFHLHDFKKAFGIFNEIYQKFYTKDYTVDFYTHSRIIYSLTCYEIEEFDLMVSTANSVTEFLKRNSVFFRFEKKFLRFIITELATIQEKSKQERIKKFEKLRMDLDGIFESSYERKVLNYFDYYQWIDTQLARYSV
jgi:tetratricopeptide (TPR) repeat protein